MASLQNNSNLINGVGSTCSKENRIATITSKEGIRSAYKNKASGWYTTAFGAHNDFSANANLGPPNGLKVPKEDDKIGDYYKALQSMLFENNLPETCDRTSCPRTQFTDDDVTIVILSSPVECMAKLLNGGNKSPGNMLLVMSTSWIEKRKSKTNSDLFSLFVHKAITFESSGRTFIDEFKPARKVTYFMNFFTTAVTMGQRNDGAAIEKDLDCPMSSSLTLLEYTDNKLWTRILMAKKCPSCQYPETLAFCYKPKIEYADDVHDIRVVKLDTKLGVENTVLQNVKEFLPTLKNCPKVVVKPSGTIWFGSVGVSFHDVTNVKAICSAVLDVLNGLNAGDSILVETFYETKVVTMDIGSLPAKRKPKETMDEYSFRLRATCCRGFGNRPVCSMFVCGIGKKSEPIKGGNTVSQSLDTTLAQYGLTEQERDVIVGLTKTSAEELMKALMHEERDFSRDERGCIGSQTDLIGIDFVLGKKGNSLVPIIIEVNGHDCTINCQRYEFMNSYLQGQSVGPLIDTMIERSLKFIMSGKYILVIGAGRKRHEFVWEEAPRFGIKIILVDSAITCPAANQVDTYIYYNFTDHTKDTSHARKIIDSIKNAGLDQLISGCCAFWEDCGPLAALICDVMGLNGHGVSGSQIAKTKSLTQDTLQTRTADIPHFPRTNLYVARHMHLSNVDDIPDALEEVGLPAVLKLEYGSGAVGVHMVNTEDECVQVYKDVRNTLKKDEDHPGVGLGYGNSLMLMDFLYGTEHEIEVVIYRRRLIGAYISDKGPTRENSFTETSACLPSCLPKDKKAQLTTAAYQCVTEIGLINGVFNVEMIMTTTGPKLIDINLGMSGFYIRDWVKRCYNIDLLFTEFLISCGVKPYLPVMDPKLQLLGIMCVPSVHAALFKDQELCTKIQNMTNNGEIFVNAEEMDYQKFDKRYNQHHEEPICSIAVTADSIAEAKKKLLKVCLDLGINGENFDVQDLLSYFKQYRNTLQTN